MSQRPQRILMIDDDPDFRLAVSTRLKSEGYEITELGSGREGIEAANASNYDLILIDMLMPDKDGVTTSIQARSTI